MSELQEPSVFGCGSDDSGKALLQGMSGLEIQCCSQNCFVRKFQETGSYKLSATPNRPPLHQHMSTLPHSLSPPLARGTTDHPSRTPTYRCVQTHTHTHTHT